MSRVIALVAATLGYQQSGKERLATALALHYPTDAPHPLRVLSPTRRKGMPAATYVIEEQRLGWRAGKNQEFPLFAYGTVPRLVKKPYANIVLDTFFGPGYPTETLTARIGNLYRRTSVPRGTAGASWVAALADEDVLAWCRSINPSAPIVPLAPGVDIALAQGGRRRVIREPYILMFGGTSRRKNTATQLQASLLVARRYGMRVVVVGHCSYSCDDPPIVRLSSVPDDALASLYRHASAVCAAPLAEGWGLPVLEALASGASVAASMVPSLRHLTRVVGHAIEGVEPVKSPLQVECVAAALERALQRGNTPASQSLLAKLDNGYRVPEFWRSVFPLMESL